MGNDVKRDENVSNRRWGWRDLKRDMDLSRADYQVSVQRQLCSAPVQCAYSGCPLGKRAMCWVSLSTAGELEIQLRESPLQLVFTEIQIPAAPAFHLGRPFPRALQAHNMGWGKSTSCGLVSARILPDQEETFLQDSSWLGIELMNKGSAFRFDSMSEIIT